METIDGSSSNDRVPFKAAILKRGRSSKKLITDKQSMHAVVYNDDLLIEILLRLPVISLFLFKSVCKRWLSLISSPSFTRRRSLMPILDPPSSLILPTGRSGTYDFVSFDTRIPCKKSALSTTFTSGSKLHNADILHSCNGLLLCCGGRKNRNDKFYVYNPSINIIKMLPRSPIRHVNASRIAFDPSKSPHYKVIQTVLMHGHDVGIQIQTYSSETCKWSVCSEQYPYDSFLYFHNGIYWNDAIYWLNSLKKPNLLFKLDISVEHHALTPIETLDGNVPATCDCMLFESRGCLLLLCDECNDSRQIDIYEMRNGCSGWSVKYSVDLNDIFSPFPSSWSIHSRVWSIVLGEQEEDSFMVIEFQGMILQYKPALQTFCELGDLGSAGHPFSVFQFTVSFSSAGV